MFSKSSKSLHKRSARIVRNNLITEIILWIIVIFTYIIPFYYIFINAVKNQKEVAALSLALPTEWRFDNFVVAFRDGKMLTGLGNSIIIAIYVVIGVIVLASFAAFYIQRSGTKFARVIYYMFLLGIAMPISIITTFALLQKLSLLNTILGVSIIYVAIRLPFTIFIYVGFIRTIPRELDEAAIIDGCGGIRLFFQVIMPLLKPITATVVVLTAQFTWNVFDIILYFIQSSSKFTMPISIYTFYGMYSSRWNLIFAGAILTVLPVLVIYLFCQKYIVSGLAAGAVKG